MARHPGERADIPSDAVTVCGSRHGAAEWPAYLLRRQLRGDAGVNGISHRKLLPECRRGVLIRLSANPAWSNWHKAAPTKSDVRTRFACAVIVLGLVVAGAERDLGRAGFGFEVSSNDEAQRPFEKDVERSGSYGHART